MVGEVLFGLIGLKKMLEPFKSDSEPPY